MISVLYLLKSFSFFILAAMNVTKNNALGSSSLVLGLTHSRTSISNSNNHHPMQLADMVEPLREIKDGYLIPLSFGTPPQVIQVYMDTGSDLTWLPCINHSPFDCIECDENTNSSILKKNILFSPSHSSTSLHDSCASPYCIDIHSSDNMYDPCAISGCSISDLMRFTCYKPCPPFSYTYGGDRVIVGTLNKDVLGVHGTGSDNAGVIEIPRFRFGCVSASYGEPIGIAGFGRGSLSLMSQLGFLQQGFSHCFLPFKFSNNANISSPLIIGDLAINSNEHLHFTTMLKSPKYPNLYYIGLESVSVGNQPLAAEVVPQSLKEIDSQGNGGMLMDSGTTYTHLPDPVYSQLIASLKAVIQYPRATEVEARSGFDLCYTIPCSNINDDDHLPTITFHFLNNVDLVLPNGNCFYAMKAPSNSSVVKCLLMQSMVDSEYGPAGVLGSFQQQNVEVVYDLNKERVGFKVTDCAVSAVSQGLHKA